MSNTLMTKSFSNFLYRLERNGKATVKGVKFFIESGFLYMDYGDGDECDVCAITGIPSVDRLLIYDVCYGLYPF